MGKSEFDRGKFLTETQRKYLQGNHEPPSDNAESQVRSKIRARTKAAIHDLGLIARNLEQKDRSLLLNAETPTSTNLDEMTQLTNGNRVPLPTDEEGEYGIWGWVGFSMEMGSILEFYYKTLREQELEEGSNFSRSNITESIQASLESAERDYLDLPPNNHSIEATVEVETVDDVDLDKAKKRYQQGKDLRPIEVKALIESDHAKLQVSNE